LIVLILCFLRRVVSPGKHQLPFAFDIRLNQILDKWHKVAMRFREENNIRDGDKRAMYLAVVLRE